MNPQTLSALFWNRVAQSGDRVALHTLSDDRPRPATWNRLADDVRQLAAVLLSRGVGPGDRVVQISENRYEWIVADLAILTVRAVHVPVHAPLAAPQIAAQIQDAGARVVLLSGVEQAQKLASPSAQLLADMESLAEVDFVSYDACEKSIGGNHVLPLCGLIAGLKEGMGKNIETGALACAAADDLATILYTSGTTGEPKGVMLTHRNLLSNTLATLSAFDVNEHDMRLSFLPWSHIFARTCDLYLWIASGSQLALAQGRGTVLDDCLQITPTLLNGVPYFFDRVVRGLRDKNLDDDPAALQAALGGRIRVCCSGGAALPDHTARYYIERGVPLLQGYGLTETSPVMTIGTPAANRIGTVGRAVEDVEIRIADDGEILTRGPNLMAGYWNRPRATAEAIREGWFHTGDLGRLDDEGFLRITGRKKELIVTAAGKNIAPVMLESLLTEDPWIEQAMVIGDGRNYLTALIVPNRQAGGLSGEMTRSEIESRFAQHIDGRLCSVSHHEQIRRFTLIEGGFTIESGELTPTLKIRRDVISKNHAADIEAMYE